MISEQELDIIAHSLGINLYHAKLSNYKKDSILPNEFYRNYYCYGREKESLQDKFKNLLELGFIETFKKFSNSNFYITDKGILYFREYFIENITNKFKPLSRSKQKYQNYIHSETDLSFAEYLGINEPELQNANINNGILFWKVCGSLKYESMENKSGFRYVSTKYFEVKGDWCKNAKEAKKSYKKILNDYLNNK